MSQVLSRSFEN